MISIIPYIIYAVLGSNATPESYTFTYSSSHHYKDTLNTRSITDNRNTTEDDAKLYKHKN